VLCFFAAKWRAKLLNRMVRSIHRKWPTFNSFAYAALIC
jgi:hypothetical protein